MVKVPEKDEIVSILVVDDREEDRFLIQRALRQNNLINEIMLAEDGEEALAILADTTRVKPRLVLLDVKMPKMDGLETLEQIRTNPYTKDIPVVMLTTSDLEHDARKAMTLGANSYVTKPVNFAEFVEAVQVIGLYWALIHRMAGEIDDSQANGPAQV